MGCLWDAYGMLMGCLWDAYGMLDGTLEGLVEELLDALRYAQSQSEGIAEDVETEDEDVELLDGLSGVVPLEVAHELRPAEERVRSLKVAQPEDDVLYFR